MAVAVIAVAVAVTRRCRSEVGILLRRADCREAEKRDRRVENAEPQAETGESPIGAGIGDAEVECGSGIGVLSDIPSHEQAHT